MSIFRLKDLAELRSEIKRAELKKTLGAFDLVLLGLGGIIGTGIFVLTGLAAAQYAGPAISISFILGAVACIFTALAYSELATMLPVCGSAYSYAYSTLGEVIALMVGWLMIMVFTYGSATVASGWSGYIIGILNSGGVHLPDAITKIPSQGGVINFPAVLIVGILTFLLYRGTKDAVRLNGLLVFIKITAIFIFILCAVPHANLLNWQDYAPKGFFGVAAGAAFVFMAYTGFDTVATAAEECKNPKRDLPIGIIGSLVGAAILYVIVSGLLTLIVPYPTLNNPEPMARALRENGISIGAQLVAIGALAGMTTVILSNLYGQSRLLLMMARDGLLPRFFIKVHPRFDTPHVGVLISGTTIALIAGFAPVSTLGQLSSMSTLATFAMVSISVMVMRSKFPNENRPFSCPAVYFVASMSALLCLFLFGQLFVQNWMPFMATMAAGIIVYALYGYRNSVMKSGNHVI